MQQNFTIQMVSTVTLLLVALWEYVALRKAKATTA
jgi:low temperature requirement protein LtrA